MTTRTLETATAEEDWIAGFLRVWPGDGDPDACFPGFRERIAATSFAAIVDAAQATSNQAAMICLYRHWIAVQPAGSPLLFAAWFNLAVALSHAGDRANAIAGYQTTLALRPDFHSAAINLGLLLESLGDSETALQTWERALQPNDARTALLNNRARLLEQLGRLEDAEREMRRSLLIDPKQPDVVQHWVHARQKMCAWPILTDAIPGLSLQDLTRHAGALGTLALTDDIRAQREAAEDWIRRKTIRPPVSLSPAHGYGHDRIRVGYLSSDFCRHAMSYLIAELFECHDRAGFEIFGYCSSPDDGSEIRARILRAFDHVRRIRTLSDEQAAHLIRADEIDILVDLNGLTSGARLQITRWKPAPVQATYLGFIGAVPLPELDYMFCDHIVVPPERAAAYQPTPLYIAPNYQANDSKRTIGRATTRRAAGLPDDRFVFCCFSNHYKITEEVFDAWMVILRAAGDAVLWLVGDNETARRNMLARAATHGIDSGRLLFATRVDPDQYMARLAVADLFLDTFPYNAGTIASDAIRMGLPLLTIQGQSFASRMAARQLIAVGAAAGITTSIPEYIERAVRFATDPDSFRAYRRLFDEESWSRGIGDVTGFTRSYEAALRSIVKRG